jgi:hypothetical protein
MIFNVKRISSGSLKRKSFMKSFSSSAKKKKASKGDYINEEVSKFSGNKTVEFNQKQVNEFQDSLSESKKNSIINKFHKIYSKLTGKKFIVESSKDNFIESYYRDKLKQLELLLGVVSLLSIINSIGHYELSYSATGYDNLKGNKFSPLLYSCSILTLILIMLIYFTEKIHLEYEKEIQKLQKSETLFTTGRYIGIIFKIFISIFHPNPIFEGRIFTLYNDQTSHYFSRPLNSLMTIISFFRFYFVFRSFLYQSSFMDPESKKICRMYNFESDIFYCLKSMIKNSPLKIYFFSLVIFVFIFSYSIRIFERVIEIYDFDNYWNSIWYVFITMLTVGYGDLTSKTNEGRIIVMISCAVGCFLISMMIVAVTNIFTFNINEVNAFIIMERSAKISETELTAKKVVYNFTKILSKSSYKQILANHPHKLKNLLKNIKKFQDVMYNSYCADADNDISCFYNYLDFIDTKQESLLKYKKSREEKIQEIKNKIHHIESELNNSNVSSGKKEKRS